MLKNFTIENYKNLQFKGDLIFNPKLNIFIGPNNRGKSNSGRMPGYRRLALVILCGYSGGYTELGGGEKFLQKIRNDVMYMKKYSEIGKALTILRSLN